MTLAMCRVIRGEEGRFGKARRKVIWLWLE